MNLIKIGNLAGDPVFMEPKRKEMWSKDLEGEWFPVYVGKPAPGKVKEQLNNALLEVNGDTKKTKTEGVDA